MTNMIPHSNLHCSDFNLSQKDLFSACKIRLVIHTHKGIGTVEECVKGNEPVKGATMGFQKFPTNRPMVIIR